MMKDPVEPCEPDRHHRQPQPGSDHPDAGLEPDDRVGIAWLQGTCGRCGFCSSGRENLCLRAQFTGYQVDGGYAEYAVVPAPFAYPIPPVFSDDEAAPLLLHCIYVASCLLGPGRAVGESAGSATRAHHQPDQQDQQDDRADYGHQRPQRFVHSSSSIGRNRPALSLTIARDGAFGFLDRAFSRRHLCEAGRRMGRSRAAEGARGAARRARRPRSPRAADPRRLRRQEHPDLPQGDRPRDAHRGRRPAGFGRGGPGRHVGGR